MPRRRDDVSGGLIYLALSSLWLYVVLMLVCLVGFTLQLVLFAATAFFDANRRVCGHFFRFLARLVVRANWLWRFDVYGPRRMPFSGGAVVVSNHESHTDVFLISHLGWEMKWLAKRSLFRIPLIGWLMALAGDVPIDRGSKASADTAMASMRRYLQRGMPVFLFPEGTRAITSELLPFKQGAFRLAIEAGVPIVPLAVAGTRTALTKHSWKFGRSRALVCVGEPIDTRPMAAAAAGAERREALAQLMQTTRQQILRMRAQLQAHTSIAIEGGGKAA